MIISGSRDIQLTKLQNSSSRTRRVGAFFFALHHSFRLMTGQTFFEQVTLSYADVPIEGGIKTTAFLQATEDLIKLFDFLNPTAFAPVKNDMTGNVKKIREAYNKNPEKYSTLQAIVEDEVKLPQKQRVGTEGLIWLRRGLEFNCLALTRNLADLNEELAVSFTKAYEQTLQKFHNMFVKPIFYLAMKAVPYRKDFYKKIGGEDEQALMAKLKPWLAGLDKCLRILAQFFADGKYEY